MDSSVPRETTEPMSVATDSYHLVGQHHPRSKLRTGAPRLHQQPQKAAEGSRSGVNGEGPIDNHSEPAFVVRGL